MQDLFNLTLYRPGAFISVTDWEAYIESDPELDPTPFLLGKNPKTQEDIRVPTFHGAVWNSHPNGIEFCFQLQNGRVCSEWTDVTTLEKAKRMAHALRAEIEVNID